LFLWLTHVRIFLFLSVYSSLSLSRSISFISPPSSYDDAGSGGYDNDDDDDDNYDDNDNDDDDDESWKVRRRSVIRTLTQYRLFARKVQWWSGVCRSTVRSSSSANDSKNVKKSGTL